MVVTYDIQGSRVKEKEASGSRIEVQPTSGEDTEKMTMGKDQQISIAGTQPLIVLSPCRLARQERLFFNLTSVAALAAPLAGLPGRKRKLLLWANRSKYTVDGKRV